jgi:hypothetical protein
MRAKLRYYKTSVREVVKDEFHFYCRAFIRKYILLICPKHKDWDKFDTDGIGGKGVCERAIHYNYK